MEVPTDSVQVRPDAPMVMKDIDPFKSPVDGSVIIGRRSLREHNKRNNVTHADDFKNYWKEKEKERERFRTGDPTVGRKERIQALVDAYDKLSRRR